MSSHDGSPTAGPCALSVRYSRVSHNESSAGVAASVTVHRTGRCLTDTVGDHDQHGPAVGERRGGRQFERHASEATR